MTQPQTQLLAGFNYADPNSAGDYLPQVKLEENKPILVSFLKDIPGMQSPPFVYCKVHWNSEMGDGKGRRYQCFGGQCCEQVTWQKGFGGQPGKFAPNKATTRYYIPLVTYEADPSNQTQMRATVKYIDITWVAYNSLCTAIQNTEGMNFFERDVLITTKKVNGATDYIFDRREGKAQWIVNPEFNKQVNDQLPKVAEKLLLSLPKAMTEAEFMAMKPDLDTRVQAAMGTNNAQNTRQPQAQFGSLPQGFAQPQNVQQAFIQQPAQQFTQPQVNIPVQTQPTIQQSIQQPIQQHPFEQIQTQPVQQFTQPQVNIPVQTPIVETTQSVVQEPVAQPVIETPQQVTQEEAVAQFNSLDFDPSQLLK